MFYKLITYDIMPFIALAVVVALALGGGVTVAADQAHPGDALYSYKVHVNDNVRHEYHAIKASIHGDAEVEGDASTKRAHRDSDDTATTTLSDYPDDHGGLRIRSDAGADAKALDDKINADGSLKVDLR